MDRREGMYTTFVEMAVKQVKKTCEKSFEFGREDGFFIDKNPMEECVICMEYIKDSDKAVLKCGHQFHASCMFSNVVRENNTCPLCRAEVSEKPEKKPEMTEGLMRMFIQNEFNTGNLHRSASGIFNQHRTWFENNVSAEHGTLGEARYEDVSLEDRAALSEDLILLLIQFGMRLGGQVSGWIREGDSRLHIPHEFTENEPIRVPLEAYMQYQEGAEERKDDDDDESSTDSDMPSLMSISDEDYDDGEIEPVNLRALFEDEADEPEIERLAIERSQQVMETIALNLESVFPENAPGEPNYFIERIQGNEWLYHHLADGAALSIEEIMWPIGGSGIRALFTQEQAEAIFEELMRYRAEGHEP